jgi:hypothetical protein
MTLHVRAHFDGRAIVPDEPVDLPVNEPLEVRIDRTAATGAENGSRADWHRFVEQTYGSCAGLGIERPPQGEFEKRENIE